MYSRQCSRSWVQWMKQVLSLYWGHLQSNKGEIDLEIWFINQCIITNCDKHYEGKVSTLWKRNDEGCGTTLDRLTRKHCSGEVIFQLRFATKESVIKEGGLGWRYSRQRKLCMKDMRWEKVVMVYVLKGSRCDRFKWVRFCKRARDRQGPDHTRLCRPW